MNTKLGKRNPFMTAMSYGPFSLLKALIVGLVLGSLVFIALAGLTGAGDHAQQMRVWLYIVGTGLALSLTLSAVVNYIVGSRVQQQIEHSRRRFSGSQVRSPQPQQKESGFILRPDKEQTSPEPAASLHDSSQFEGQH